MPGSYSSQGPVIDAILTLIAGLSAVTTADPPVVVFDGPPGGAHVPDTFIAIAGQEREPRIATGTEEWAWLGTGARYENYNIVGHVYAYVGGDDNLGQYGTSAQKTARDQATVLMQAIEEGLIADVKLANENNGLALVIWAYVTQVDLDQTPVGDPSSAKGRWAQYDFTINVKNTLTGPNFYDA